jgi:hypothetical protein
MSKRTIGALLVFIVVAIIIGSSLTESGPNDLDVQFEEIDFVRNENNTGPVIRRYLVAVSDTIWADLQSYGDLMPYSKLGETEVYYFLEGTAMPQSINLQGPPFDQAFESSLIGRYTKNNMGQSTLKKY